jgi:hypothetical protein
MNKKIISYCIKPGKSWTNRFYDVVISDYKIDIQIDGNPVYVCFLWYTAV